MFEIEDNTIPERNIKKPVIVYGDVIIGVHGENFSMMFDKKEGGISSLKYNGFEYITRTPKVSFWRAMTDNDMGASEPINLAQWFAAGKFAKFDAISHTEHEDSLEISFTYKTASHTMAWDLMKTISTETWVQDLAWGIPTQQEELAKKGDFTLFMQLSTTEKCGAFYIWSCCKIQFQLFVLEVSVYERAFQCGKFHQQ